MTHDTLRHSRLPLYLQVAEILRQRIMRGQWKEGELMPTLTALAKEFDVAKVTVRQAVKILAEEGRLASHRGRGTTVLPQPKSRRPLKVETRLADLIEMYRGDRPELVNLDDRAADLPGDVEIGTAVDSYHLIRRMHARDGRRYCVITLYFAKPIFERHEERLRRELALPVLFEAPDVNVRSARQTMVIGKCDIETAGHLGLSIGDPVAYVRRVLCDEEGYIIYLADVVYRGDYIRLDMDLMA